MKIGFLSIFNFGTNIGGVENHIYFMANELIKLGHEIIIFQPIEAKKYFVETKTFDKIKVIYIPIVSSKVFSLLNKYNGNKYIGYFTAFLNKAKYIFSYQKIANELLKYDLDIVHQHDFISNIFSTKYLKSKGQRVLLTNHTGEYLFFINNVIGRRILPFLLNHYDYIIGPSKELTPINYVKNSVTIHNGTLLNEFYSLKHSDKINLKKELLFHENDFLIFCPRRWAPTKGVKYLVEAIYKFENDFKKNIKFIFAGNDYDGYPEYRDELLEIIFQVKDKSKYTLLGNLQIHQMIQYYQISDITIIPSLMEAVSLSAVEAMASGSIVIATNVGGMPELIEDKINGYLIEPKNNIVIRDTIQYLYDNRLKMKEIRNNAFRSIENYDWKTIANKTDKIYNEVVCIDVNKVSSCQY